ncbi:MAG: acetyl-CoA acetyltransferase [Herpetosiphonaceae bacterium]|nr:acetyl-CoA acetyltransferase [Herpetosiphonaceae bacterium]
MRPVYLIGAGQTPVAEHWDRSLEQLAGAALQAALDDAGQPPIQALYVANALGGLLNKQAQLGAHLVAALRLGAIEGYHIEAAGASGGAALHQAFMAVSSGVYQCVAVVGVEKVTDVLENELNAALATGLDATAEADQGLTLTAGWALLQQRYSYEHDYTASSFAPWPVTAHANALHNPNALYRFPLNPGKVAGAPAVATPIGLLDSSTVADGAAALIIAAAPQVEGENTRTAIRVAGSSLASVPLALGARPDPLWLDAVARSTIAALAEAQLDADAVNVAELSDQHGIVAALSLEASGFAPRGMAPRLAADGAYAKGGSLSLATAGGCKARGDTVGALGIYQIVELAAQLWGEAGSLQVPGVRVALAQCLGGLGATAATHVLVKE